MVPILSVAKRASLSSGVSLFLCTTLVFLTGKKFSRSCLTVSIFGRLSIPKVYHKKSTEKIVLVGGCFDVLHPGHIIFLEKAKKAGDRLVVLLESDGKIKKLKGLSRPVHNQKERALVLKALKFVDQVISLPHLETETAYDEYVAKIKPDIIAVTSGDPQNHHKKRSAKLVGAKLKFVTKRIGNHSTTKLLNR